MESSYSVKELCTMMQITRKTLFYYDRIGLLKPSDRKGVQNHKLYDISQKQRLADILKYRRAGLKIEEVRLILDSPECDVRTILEGALNRLDRQKKEKESQIRVLKELMEEMTG